ncbi:unnamed protein product [Schistosoma turkestanicum]|nr:unnamed protein product [Schistosoma turkestanicum]
MGMDEGVRKPVPAICLLPVDDHQHRLDIRDPEIEWSWQLAGVLDYDVSSKLWFVQKVDSSGRIVDENGKPVVNVGLLPREKPLDLQTQYWIPRIQVMFLAEDPQIFARRVATAFKSRQEHESALRYNLCLDCMPNERIGELSSVALRRMTFLAKDDTCSVKSSKRIDSVLQNLEKEVTFDYWRSMNDLVLRQVIENQKTKYSFIQPPELKRRKTPWKGTLDIPLYDFDNIFQSFSSKSMLTKPEAVMAICKCQYECLEVRSKSIFHVSLLKHMRIEEFEQTQSMVISQVSVFLKDAWIENLRKYIRSCFCDIGKGWFNIYETDFYVYTQSKLKKFMEMMKFCMQDGLRFLIMESLVNFTNMLRDSCIACLDIPNDYEWSNDLMTSSLPPKKNPLFLVDLLLDTDGPHYSTPTAQFPNILIQIFDKAINSTQDIPQIEQYVIEGITWAEKQLLEAVGLHEPPVYEKLRQQCTEYINFCFDTIESLCLNNMNVLWS